MPNQNSRNLWFFVKTILNGTTYYSYKIASISIVNANPFIDTIDYGDVNSDTADFTGDASIIIQGLSRLRFYMFDIEALKGSSLTTLSVNINGNVVTTPFTGQSIVSADYTYGEVDVSENTTAVLTLTDTRGNSSSYNVPLTIWEYDTPTAIITEYRENNFYSESHIKVDARYSSLHKLNTIAIKYRIKKSSDSTWGAWVTIQDNVEADFTADNQYAWDIQVELDDAIGGYQLYTINKALDVGIPIVFYDVEMRSVGINKLPTNNESFEIEGSMIVNSKDYSDILIPYVLYDNQSGSNQNITLSDNSSNYDYLEVFYYAGDMFGSLKIDTTQNKGTITLTNDYNQVHIFQIKTMTLTANGTTLQRGAESYVNLVYDGTNVINRGTESAIKIYKVIGYK